MADEPRSLAQRLADTRARLADDIDSWLATADGDRPWLVPLSHLWLDGELLYVTDADSRTGGNVIASPAVRVSLGHTRDVVMIEGQARLSPIAEMTDGELEAFQAKHGSDPRTWADAVIRVRPTRVQAWREANELEGRTLMRQGQWLDVA